VGKDGRSLDRTIGMHVKVNTNGLTEAEAKQKNKQASLG